MMNDLIVIQNGICHQSVLEMFDVVEQAKTKMKAISSWTY